MMMFLVLKERLRSFYGKYGAFTNGVIKFGYSLMAILMLNQNIGFMTKLKNPFVPLVLALVCAFLPSGAIAFLLAAIMLMHIYTVSFEIALITAVFLIIVALLYYGFQPGDSYWLVLTPVAFILKIPFAVPLLAGLSGSLVTVIPVSCGVVIYYVLMYVKQNAGVLTNDASVDITQKFVLIIKALVSNKFMLVMICMCMVGILVVYLLKTLSIDYAWILAIILGTIVQLAAVFVGDYLFDVSIPIGELVVGAVIALVLAGLYHFFVFAVDYSRTEYTQFEDDDYVYYVKAVPKVAVSKPDVRVQRINNPGKARRMRE
ncbi:ABC transporter permease [Clostridium sp. AN503]|uniref:ABC transporter permease n=1 Tax=Clostridium sp. AN503 TaxID=3160598 RepID=UPI00345AC118